MNVFSSEESLPGHVQNNFSLVNDWVSKTRTIPYQACSLQLYQILWSGEERWSYNSSKQKNFKFKSYCCALQCFTGYAMRTIPVFFVALFKTADFTATIPGRLNAVPGYTKIFAVCFISRKGSRIWRGKETRSLAYSPQSLLSYCIGFLFSGVFLYNITLLYSYEEFLLKYRSV
jgi:hypothetical protein